MNNPHQNARTCFYSREQIVERYQNGEKAPSIAAAFGISVRTVYKWLKRFREHGPSGLIARVLRRPYKTTFCASDKWPEVYDGKVRSRAGLLFTRQRQLIAARRSDP